MRNLEDSPQTSWFPNERSPGFLRNQAHFFWNTNTCSKTKQRKLFLYFLLRHPLSPLSILTQSPVVPSHAEQLDIFCTSAGESILRPLHHEDAFSRLKWNRDCLFIPLWLENCSWRPVSFRARLNIFPAESTFLHAINSFIWPFNCFHSTQWISWGEFSSPWRISRTKWVRGQEGLLFFLSWEFVKHGKGWDLSSRGCKEKRIHWKDDKPSRESVFYMNFWVVLNETGKRVCGEFLSWLFYSVLLAPNTEGNPKTLGSCPWCCPPFRVGDHFRKQLFLNNQCPPVHFYADTP